MSEKVKSATHSDELSTGVAKLLSDTTHKHSDVQLKVGGNIFYCHKLILALQCPYFEQKLYPSSSAAPVPAASQQIVLNDISADTFDKVLQFMYTGETELSGGTVDNILAAADLLQLPALMKCCDDYLADRVSPDTCLGYWRVAEQMNLDALVFACKRLCLKEFGKSSFSSKLSRLSENMMKELLEDDGLVVESEVDVCETFMTWLNSQNESGNSVSPHQLLTLIRWSGVPVEYIKSRLITNSILMADRQCFEFLSKVISYRLTGVQFSELNTFHRLSVGVEQSVVIVGINNGSKVSSDAVRVDLQRKDKVTSLTAIPTRMQRELAACVSSIQMFVTGAGADNNETWKWESSFGWMQCADMIQGRRRHCATFANNTSMYVLGGFVQKVALDSIEQYNTVTNKWTKVGLLKHAAESAVCVVYKSSIYMFGGSGQNDVTLDSVQVFDTATKVCTELTQRLPQPLSALRAVMWDKSVILIKSSTCVIFDLEQQTFQQRDQFAAGVKHFGLALENQRIFIIGGGNSHTDAAGKTKWTCVHEVKSVAVMDIINNETTPNWIHHAKLPTPTLVQAHASMTLPTNLK